MDHFLLKISNEYLEVRPQLEFLIEQLIATQGKCKFESNEQTLPLIKKGVLKQTENGLEVQANFLTGFSFLKYFEIEFNFSINDDFNNTEIFINNIEDFFRSSNIQGWWSFTNLISGIVLISQTTTFGADITSYVLSKSKNDGRDIFDLNESVNNALPYLNINTEETYKIINHLLQEIKGDMTIYKNFEGIRTFVTKNPDQAESLLNYLLTIGNSEEGFLSTVLTTLNNNNQQTRYIDLAIKLLKSKKLRDEALSSLISFNYRTKEEFIRIFNIISKLSYKEESFIVRQVRFYIESIVNSFSDIDIKNNSLTKLEEIVKTDSSWIQNSTLRNLSILKNQHGKAFRLLTLIDIDKVDKHMLNLQLKDFNSAKKLFLFIKKCIDKKGVNKFDVSYFENAILSINKNTPTTFSTELIRLIIDDKGTYRYIGNKILHKLAHNKRTHFTFDMDLNSLSQEHQHRLAASILIHIDQPENTIPTILPLARSRYYFIRLFIRFKLEELIFVFSSSILQTLEKKLDTTDANDLELFTNIRTKYNEFSQMFDKKIIVKEFDPNLSQAKVFEKYKLDFNKHYSEAVHNTADKDEGFLSYISKVALGRGKGWKMANSKDKTQLTKFHSSFQLPRDYLISPDLHDFLTRIEILNSWEKKKNE